MNKTITSAIIIFILVVISALGVKLILPEFEEREQKITSDAFKTKGKITIAVDNWIGYFILNSPEMKNQMRRTGYTLLCEDDKADYHMRMQRLKHGEIDFAVATVDSYILNASTHNYPGAIVMVIDESKGGDAILARKDKIKNLDDLKTKSQIKVAFTPNSPSHHLAKAAADHFNVPSLIPKGTLRIETNGSEEAREQLLSSETDVAICWEPDVSHALNNKEIVKILGTEDTERLIVDILIVNRQYIKQNPGTVNLLLNNYFKILKKYRDQPDLLFEHVKQETGLSEESITSMLKGVKWVNFRENCENWFGISAPGNYSDEGLIDTIESSVKILVNNKDFNSSPIPNDDPYRLTNSSFLEMLFNKGITGFNTAKTRAIKTGSINSIAAAFQPLDESRWSRLREVGTLKVEPINFQHGTAQLDVLAKKVIDQAVERLRHYPNFRIIIKGHTGIRGDKQQNLKLSQGRADAVAIYLKDVYNVNTNRLKSIGFGSEKPLPKMPEESRRAWNYRLPRVEFVLVQEDF